MGVVAPKLDVAFGVLKSLLPDLDVTILKVSVSGSLIDFQIGVCVATYIQGCSRTDRILSREQPRLVLWDVCYVFCFPGIPK